MLLCWDAALVSHVNMSPDARGCRCIDSVLQNIISSEPTNDFTVAVTNRKSTPHPGVVVGFTTRAVFMPDSANEMAWSDGVYALCPRFGMLHGSGKYNFDFCAAATSGTVRCVADRVSRTIVMHVNGVERGIAWTDVPPEPLHALVMFFCQGVKVQLL